MNLVYMFLGVNFILLSSVRTYVDEMYLVKTVRGRTKLIHVMTFFFPQKEKKKAMKKLNNNKIQNNKEVKNNEIKIMT